MSKLPRRDRTERVRYIIANIERGGGTRSDFARITGIDRKTIDGWFDSSPRSPSNAMCEIIEATTGYSAEWLRTGEGAEWLGAPTARRAIAARLLSEAERAHPDELRPLLAAARAIIERLNDPGELAPDHRTPFPYSASLTAGTSFLMLPPDSRLAGLVLRARPDGTLEESRR